MTEQTSTLQAVNTSLRVLAVLIGLLIVQVGHSFLLERAKPQFVSDNAPGAVGLGRIVSI